MFQWGRRLHLARRQFGREFKVEAVRLVQDRGVSVAPASCGMDAGENVLRHGENTDLLAGELTDLIKLYDSVIAAIQAGELNTLIGAVQSEQSKALQGKRAGPCAAA